MTRYGMAIDLNRCFGCQTCAVACKMANNLPNDVLFNQVKTVGGDSVDTAAGEYPNCTLSYLPFQCQHCENPAVPRCVSDGRYRQGRGDGHRFGGQRAVHRV